MNQIKHFDSALDAIQFFKDSMEQPEIMLAKTRHGKYQVSFELPERIKPKIKPPIPQAEITLQIPDRLEEVFRVASEVFQADIDGIKSRLRDRIYAFPRFFVMYYLRVYEGMTYKNIGKVLYRDHSTAVHGIVQYTILMEMDEAFRKKAEKALEELSSIHPN
jgi:hypothetical protein